MLRTTALIAVLAVPVGCGNGDSDPGPSDAGVDDAGPTDASSADSGMLDAGRSDASSPDAGAVDSYPRSMDEVGATASACPDFPADTIGSIEITTDGHVLENVIVEGRIKVEAANVVLRCVRAQGGLYTLHCDASDGCTELHVIDSEFRGATSAAVYLTAGATNVTLERSIFGVAPDAIKINASGNTLRRNHIDCLMGSTESHMDGLQSRSGDDNVYLYNNWSARSCPDSENQGNGSGAFFIEAGSFDRTLIHGNYFSGAGYTVRLRAEDHDNLTFTGNVVERDSYTFGPLTWGADRDDCAHWADNTYDDGAPWEHAAADDPSCTLPTHYRP